jgi:DMSO/TMAO reductase YedYZ molybdopterin-dependent catalytic subunit
MNNRFKFTRREFLRWTGMSAASLAFSGFLAACQQAIAPAANPSADPVKDILQKGAGAAAPKIVNGIPITSNEDFYTVWYSRGDVPAPSDWKLKIAGLLDRPLELSLADLKAIPAIEQMRTFECISNPVGGDLISNALWKGVRLKDLLAQAGVKPGAKELQVEAFDGFFTGIPIELALRDEALLVYEMNGEPLPREHGAPLRCIWPGRYGMKQPKWIQTITVIPDHFAGYWEKQGWTNDAFVLPNSRIDSPKDLAVISAPTFEMSGVAFSGEAGIDRLDVSWDDSNEWKPAELTRGPSPYVWTIWKWSGSSLPAGRHTLYARVTDKSGRQQARPQTIKIFGDTFPNGSDQMHSVVVDFKR